jgi:hypothetical protein
MKGILEFNLQEERDEFETAVMAPNMRSALFDVRQMVFRPARKHGYSRQDIQELVEKLDKLVASDAGKDWWPCDEYGQPKDATYLISMLEGLFSQILEESGVVE